MSFGLLGPLHVSGRALAVATPKQRVVLALLAVRPNTTVSVSAIVDELWPEDPPASAAANVRTYVSSLRKVIGPLAERLHTRAGGYQLVVAPAEVDAAVFEAAAHWGAKALQDRHWTAAATALEQALGLWRGSPLEDVPCGPALLMHADWLSALHADVVEDHCAALTATGRHAEAVTRLRRHLTTHPLRERGWLRLISALHQGGDTAAALNAFEQCRHILAEGLGIDPGGELSKLHERILRGHNTIVAPPQAEPGKSPVRELPASSHPFVGRGRLRRGLVTLLRAPLKDPSLPRLAVISGPSGFGKTALAIRAAHDVTGHFPDGQLYVNLRGHAPDLPPLQPIEAVGRLLRSLGHPGHTVGIQLDEATARLRSATAGLRLLLLLDDARDAAVVRPLLPADGRCAVIVTSRQRLSTLDAAARFEVDAMPPEEARELLTQLAGRGSKPLEADLAEAVIGLCGGLPLALRVAGLRLAAESARGRRRFAGRLGDERHRLDELGIEDLDVRSSLHVTYQALAGRHPRSALLLQRLGLMRLPSFGADVALALLDTTGPDAVAALSDLADIGLIDQADRMHRMHDLVRLYASELAGEEHRRPSRAAVLRVADRYERLASRASARYRPNARQVPDDGDVDAPQSAHEAGLWMEQHYEILIALCRQCADGDDESKSRAIALARAAYPLLPIRHPAEWINLGTEALRAAQARGDKMFADWLRVRVAAAYNDLGLTDQARALIDTALPGLRARGDRRELAMAMQMGGLAMVRSGQPGKALPWYLEVVTILAMLNQPGDYGTCLTNIAEALFALGRYDEAIAVLRRGLHLHRTRDDIIGQGITLNNIAEVHAQCARWPAAARAASAALGFSRTARHVSAQLNSLNVRSRANLRLGEIEAALADAREAVSLCDTVELRHMEKASHQHLSEVKRVAGLAH